MFFNTLPFIKDHVYIIYSKAVLPNVVDLSGGSPDNNTPCLGYPDPGDHIDTFNSQWLIREVPNNTGVYTLCNLRSGTYLNLYGGLSANETLIQGFAKATAGYEANQQWKISPTSPGYYRIQSVAAGTYMDLHGGDSKPGTIIWGYAKADTPNQEWHLSRVSRSAEDIAKIVGGHDNVAKNKILIFDNNDNVDKDTFQSYLSDAAYITLPPTVRQTIYNSTGLFKTKYRNQIFDCDDFAYVLKAAVAKWGNSYLRCDDFAILYGIMFGIDPTTQIKHALNWYLDRPLEHITFCEPQNGTEVSRTSYHGRVWVY